MSDPQPDLQPLYTETDPNGVVTVWLEQPERPVVVLDRLLISRLDLTLDRLSDHIKGFVLASRCERVYVAGADLVEIDGLSDEELDEYLTLGQRVFGRIADLPCTTVAAITGATLGGGLEIAMHCDTLVALRPAVDARQYPVGLPEAGLAICPGWGGANMLPARIDAKWAIELTATGKTQKVSSMIEAGLFADTASDAKSVLKISRERALAKKQPRAEDGPPNISWDADRAKTALASAVLPSTNSARGVRECVEAGFRDGWAAGLEAEKNTLISLRKTPEAREALDAFFAKSKPKANA